MPVTAPATMPMLCTSVFSEAEAQVKSNVRWEIHEFKMRLLWAG